MVKKNKQSSSATSSSHAKRKQKSKTPKTKEQQETEDNKADFYLDDKDADLAYDSDELENEQSEHGSELDFDENDYVSSEHEDASGDDDDDDGKEKKPKKEKKLTRAELKKIINKCTSSGSLIDLTKLVIIFTKITNPNTNETTISLDNLNNELIYTYYNDYKDFQVIPFSNLTDNHLKNYKEISTKYINIVKSIDDAIPVNTFN
jgi:hypothetical protein